MDDLLREFLTETFENIEAADREMVAFEKNARDRQALDKIFRALHTIKGSCGFIGLSRLQRLAHAGETVLGRYRDGTLEVTPASVTLILRTIDRIKSILHALEATAAEPEGDDHDLIGALEGVVGGDSKPGAPCSDASAKEQGDPLDAGGGIAPDAASAVSKQSVRVSISLLERIMMLVGELVLTRNQLLQIVRQDDASQIKVPLQRLSNVTSDLQESVMRTRMQAIGTAWTKLPRLVRSLSEDLGKKIALEMQGAETELDRQVLELVKDPLVHMVRNAADHGLESPQERVRAGKPETGRIFLRAYHEGGQVVIEVSDDGRGLSTEKIREKALKLKLASAGELERLSERDIHKFVLSSGFSTAEQVTSVSGRGVGLDVVRTNVEQIGGSIELYSTPGAGTKLVIKIPLTLAIVPALIVATGGRRYAIPQGSVVELVRMKAMGRGHRIELINQTPFLRLRDRLLSLVDLGALLEPQATRVPVSEREEAFVLVMQSGQQTFGLIVDAIHDTEEIVVKPVSSILKSIPFYSGNTILGDGTVILIIDPNAIAAQFAQSGAEPTYEKAKASEAGGRDDQKLAFLVFRAGGPQQKAIPLSAVTRLEELDTGTIQTIEGQNVVHYRGRLMPILKIDEQFRLKAEGRQPVLVFSKDGKAVGLAIDEIIDIAVDRLDIELGANCPGRRGSAVIGGMPAELIDEAFYLARAFPDWFEGDTGAPGFGAAA